MTPHEQMQARREEMRALLDQLERATIALHEYERRKRSWFARIAAWLKGLRK